MQFQKVIATYRDRLCNIVAASTILFNLTKSDPDQINQALLAASASERLHVKDARKVLKAETLTPAVNKLDPCEIEGIRGLNSLIKIKICDGLRSFKKQVREIVAGVQTAAAQKANEKPCATAGSIKCQGTVVNRDRIG